MLINNYHEYHLFAHLLIAILPIILSGTFHMLLVKRDMFSFLAIPISTGLFGANKTWRGVFFMTIVNALILWFLNSALCWYLEHSFLLGAILGLAYILFELPNSWIKRKQGIRPGEQSEKNNYLFKFLDRFDSSFGVALAYYIFGVPDFFIAFWIMIVGILVHFAISSLLVSIKVKKSL